MKLTGYRTIIFNVLAVIVALAQHYGGPLPEVDPGTLTAAVAIVNVALRFVTRTEVFKGQ